MSVWPARANVSRSAAGLSGEMGSARGGGPPHHLRKVMDRDATMMLKTITTAL